MMLMVNDDEHLVKSTNYEAPHYAIFSIHLSLCLSSKYSRQLPVLKHYKGCLLLCDCNFDFLHSCRDTIIQVGHTLSKFRLVFNLTQELRGNGIISGLQSCEGEGPGVRGGVLRAGLLTGGGGSL